MRLRVSEVFVGERWGCQVRGRMFRVERILPRVLYPFENESEISWQENTITEWTCLEQCLQSLLGRLFLQPLLLFRTEIPRFLCRLDLIKYRFEFDCRLQCRHANLDNH